MFVWIKARWALVRGQVSTKIGKFLTVASAIIPPVTAQLQIIDPTYAAYGATAGAVVGLALIFWNQGGGPANG